VYRFPPAKTQFKPLYPATLKPQTAAVSLNTSSRRSRA
jgi:hypothetical protein